MSSRIEELIGNIEEYIDNCKPKSKFMSSGTEIIVNKEEMEDLLQQLRSRIPDEVKRYQKIINQKEAILNDAREKAQKLINEATLHTNELINEHEIMQQAYTQANDVVTMATKQAQDIRDNATIEANEVRVAVMQYMEDMLAHLENIIVSATSSAVDNYQNLVNSMNHYRDIIQSNRNELHPVDEELGEVSLDTKAEETEESSSDELF